MAFRFMDYCLLVGLSGSPSGHLADWFAVRR